MVKSGFIAIAPISSLVIVLVFSIVIHPTKSLRIQWQKRCSFALKSSEIDDLAKALQRSNAVNPLDQFTNAQKKQEPPRWYESMSKLPFDCTECGKCCQTKGEVFLNPTETKNAAELLHLSVEEFKSIYVAREEEFPTDLDSVGWTVLKQKEKDGITECIFLKDQKCGIYESRPLQCSTYPFWPRFMDDVNGWNDEVVDEKGENKWSWEAGGCEGMRRVDLENCAEITEGVSISDAMEQLSMYKRYKKRFPVNF